MSSAYEDEDVGFADKVAKLCFQSYSLLGKSGKPVKGEEWTLLSCIVVKLNNNDIKNSGNLKVVSLATGSKCIGRNSMSPDGCVVNDSHAEVLARRCFLRYLYNEIKSVKNGKVSDVLMKTMKVDDDMNSSMKNNSLSDLEKYEIKTGVTFHLFSSHIPCGDASIIPKYKNDAINVGDENLTTIDSENECRIVNCNELMLKKRKLSSLGFNEHDKSIVKKSKTDSNSVDEVNEFCERSSHDKDNVEDNNKNLCDKNFIEKHCNAFVNSDGLCDSNESFGLSDLSDSIGKIISGSLNDIYRTGAKCLPLDPRQDYKGDGVDYHTLGAVRTKPGRGDPTLSVSCSDKIARWVAVGIQGALLSLLIDKPIHLSSIIIGAGGPYLKESLYRAIISRTKTEQRPQIIQSQHVFEMSKYSYNNKHAKRPSPAALMWTYLPNGRQAEVATHGRRLGTTKKSKDKGQLSICKKELFKLFVKLTDLRFLNKSYKEVKELSRLYQDNWKIVKNNLGVWTEKPSELLNFMICNVDL